MESHFESFVAILVVHVVDDAEGVAVNASQPAHHLLELSHYLIVIEVFASDSREEGRNLLAVEFIDTTVDGIEKTLSEVGASTEELHLLTDAHRRYAACNTVVVTVVRTHKVVVFVLDGRSCDRHLSAILLPVFGKTSRPKHSEVGFGCRSEVGEGVEDTEAGLGHHGATVHTHTTDRFSYPNRVTREESVVLRSAEEAHDAELHHELVDEFLSFYFRELTSLDVAFDEDVQEGRHTTDRHSSTVLVLDGSEVSEIYVLYSFASVFSRTREVETISFTELDEFLQSVDLLSSFFAELDGLIVHLLDFETIEISLLVCDEVVYTIESNTAIVTDDATTTVSIGQTGDDVAVAATTDVGSVSREHTFVVGLTILGEDFLSPRIEFVAISVEGIFHHAHTTLGEDTALERSIRLKTYYDLFVLVDVASTISGDTLGKTSFNVVETFLAFHFEHFAQFVPKGERVVSGGGEEAVIAFIGSVVELDEVANIDFAFPDVTFEATSNIGQFHIGCCL